MLSQQNLLHTVAKSSIQPTTGLLPAQPSAITEPSKQQSFEACSTSITVSNVFYPNAFDLPYAQDLVLVCADGVVFYVHSGLLLAQSSNHFATLIPEAPLLNPQEQPMIVLIPELMSVLNIILHAVYDLSCAPYAPSDADLIVAIDRLPVYGLSVQKHMAPASVFFEVVAMRLHQMPIDFYALAGRHDLYDLAVRTSAHLLGYKVDCMPLETVDRIGPIYLKRLIALQLGRQEALKALLAQPPTTHDYSDKCGMEEQSSLARAWWLVAAYFIWEMRPGVSVVASSGIPADRLFSTELTTISLEITLSRLISSIHCDLCKAAFDKRVAELLGSWAAVQVRYRISGCPNVPSYIGSFPEDYITATRQDSYVQPIRFRFTWTYLSKRGATLPHVAYACYDYNSASPEV
jgi:hypothetical protein